MKVSHLLTRARSMNNIHALVRSILTYAVCVPLAAVIGYMLTKPLTFSEAAIYSALLFILVFPLLSRSHYPIMLLATTMPVSVFFLKTSPPIGLVMALISLGVSILDRILNRRNQFLSVPGLALPIILTVLVVTFTAELSGGFGLRSLGGEVYGGKKYVFLFAGILSFFAVTARPIPPEKAKLYAGLFFLGCLPAFISDLAPLMPAGGRFIYLFIGASGQGFDQLGYSDFTFGVTRLEGTSKACYGIFLWLMSRYGVRGLLQLKHGWRLGLLLMCLVFIGLGGFRSQIMLVMIIFGAVFFMEGLHRTPLLFLFLIGGILVSAATLPFASKLPMTIQRSLSFLPIDLDPEAIASAQASSDWRINLWTSVAAEIPKYFFLGKGYAITMEDWSNIQSAGSTMNGAVNGADNSLAISSDYHNGPLSVIIPFGIWGVMCFIWMIAVCLWILVRNQRHGMPELKTLNSLLLALFIANLVVFLTVFGSFCDELGHFLGWAGLSVALNNGVAKPVKQTSRPVVQPGIHPGRYLPARPAMARQQLGG